MRIIGGAYRGRKLISPANKGIRPTSDRMRETIFNILSHSGTGLEGARVLDVFAGSGAMGLEALSRGAAHVTFFDKDRSSLQLVKKNIALIGAGDKSKVKPVTAPTFPRAQAPYDFIFLDPPFDLNIIGDCLDRLYDNGYLADDCMIVAEYAPATLVTFPDYVEVIKEKTYGDARFSFLKRIS
ncbi:MAG: 16S rRNA (guanine(966)-N(2))-methyltransferase RsmD [Alphaproteobacteria bacterium]|nr:MAG: 16S rRNA (guanine(966)-N(2))-methyltransferase RsmD [Alphaproteobacteria bacterium]